ncbi:rRNA processing protein Rrp15 [Schizosaccharomyces pombe]
MAKSQRSQIKNEDISFVSQEDDSSKKFVKDDSENSEEELEDLNSEDEFYQSNSSEDEIEEDVQESTIADDIADILNQQVTQTDEQDTPVLSLSKKSKKALRKSNAEKKDSKLRTSRRRERLRKEMVGRVTSVVAVNAETAKALFTHERELRRIARRGVVQLFNAVRTAQLQSSLNRENISGGRTAREQKVKELSKASFLDLIKSQ